MALEVRQRAFTPTPRALAFVEENRQRAKQRQHPRAVGFAHGAAVLVLGAVPAMVLAVLDGPMRARQLQQLGGVGFVGPETAHPVGDFVGVPDHAAGAQLIDVPLDAHQLRRAGQAHVRRRDGANPALAVFDAAVVLVHRPGLRGENRPAGAAGPWPGPAVDWL